MYTNVKSPKFVSSVFICIRMTGLRKRNWGMDTKRNKWRNNLITNNTRKGLVKTLDDDVL